jgi:hypothetical protein
MPFNRGHIFQTTVHYPLSVLGIKNAKRMPFNLGHILQTTVLYPLSVLGIKNAKRMPFNLGHILQTTLSQLTYKCEVNCHLTGPHLIF